MSKTTHRRRLWRWFDPRPRPGDVISAHVGERAQGVAVGKNILQNVTIIVSANPFLTLALVLGVSIAAAFAYHAVTATQPLPPMSGDLNVAIGQFDGVDAQGKVVTSADAQAFADSFARTLDVKLSSLRSLSGFDIQLRPPSQTGTIGGSTPQEQATHAERLARAIHADVIVYGNLTVGEDTSDFTPEFYLETLKLPNAEELGGQHDFGSISVLGDIGANPVFRQEMRASLLSRAEALAYFLLGLAYVDANNFHQAYSYFKAVEANNGWAEQEGKEIVYLFLGNTANQLGNLKLAQTDFAHALKLNHEYARAWLGVAEVLFQQSRGGCEAGTVKSRAGLLQAIRLYQHVLHAHSQPALSDVGTKVAFGLGRVYLCLSQALIWDDWALAEQQLKKVIATYDAGNMRVKELAAQAHGDLAVVYLPEAGDPKATEKYRRASEEYLLAIRLTRFPSLKAAYDVDLGYIYERLKDYVHAEAAYSQAMHADPPHAMYYQKLRQQVQRKRASA